MLEAGETRVVWLDDQHDIDMTFCWIPPGEFRMGSRCGHPTEQPVHRVNIENGFWLGRAPVTQRQYAASPEHAEHRNGFPEKPNHPAESMTWHDARRYCQWLSEKRLTDPEWCGWLADLPGEIQWEYACRAGTETDYYTGDGEQALAGAGWYDVNAQGMTHEVWQPGRPATKFKKPNTFGLYDMHGNVHEWCRDAWAERAYRHHANGRTEWIDAGEAVPETDDSGRLTRGGAWYILPGFCRSACRGRLHPSGANHSQGFRVGLFPGLSCPGPEAK